MNGTRVLLVLGSNIEPAVNLPKAAAHMSILGKIVACSTVYENPAIGDSSQPDFMNLAMHCVTNLALTEFRNRVRNLEQKFGRLRGENKYAPRALDIDIGFWGEQGFIERYYAFLAVPLAELQPDLVDPFTGISLAAIAKSMLAEANLQSKDEVTQKVRQALNLNSS